MASSTSNYSGPSKSAEDMKVSDVLKSAIANGMLSEEFPVALFYDLTLFRETVTEMVSQFPQSTLHGMALKANPIAGMVRQAKDLGCGAECASMGEVHMALKAGIAPENIILDSPAKTMAHLRECLPMGIFVNLDNLEEAERVAELREEDEKYCRSKIGLRVNTQLGGGSIAMTSTANPSCKFGEPLKERHADILDAYAQYPWLCGVHVHVGSQGCAVKQLVDGARAAVDLANEINLNSPGQVTNLDIGGGLSVDYQGDSLAPTFTDYATMLRRDVPELFTSEFKVMTEFGRKLSAKCGWFAARVEYIKEAGGKTIALTHAGADNFLRAVYNPDKWSHRILVFDAEGNPRTDADVINQNVAGPLCFSGDMIATDRSLPRLHAGDWIVVQDSGAYTMSMHQRHTAQLCPPVYAYAEEDISELKTFKQRETYAELAHFFGY